MIISDSRKQVFCHIPKNGGSSLRAHFATQWDDARQYQGRRAVDALGGETRDLTHITPREARQFFDDDLIGGGYTVTGVVRAPLPRFSSALLQYVRTFGGQDKNFVTADSVADILRQTSVRDLCETSDSAYRHIFFRPQVDFLADVPRDRRDLILIDALSARFPDLGVDNKGGRLPAWMGFARHPALKRLTGRLGQTSKARLSRALIRKDPAVSAAIADVVTRNRAFITDFYAQDQALYDRLSDAARANRPGG